MCCNTNIRIYYIFHTYVLHKIKRRNITLRDNFVVLPTISCLAVLYLQTSISPPSWILDRGYWQIFKTNFSPDSCSYWKVNFFYQNNAINFETSQRNKCNSDGCYIIQLCYPVATILAKTRVPSGTTFTVNRLHPLPFFPHKIFIFNIPYTCDSLIFHATL